MKNLNVKLLSLIIIAINSSHITAGDSVTSFFVGALILTAGAINPQLAVGASGHKLVVGTALTDKKKPQDQLFIPKNKERDPRGRFDKRAAGNCPRNR
jgi:hypothetical protein